MKKKKRKKKVFKKNFFAEKNLEKKKCFGIFPKKNFLGGAE